MIPPVAARPSLLFSGGLIPIIRSSVAPRLLLIRSTKPAILEHSCTKQNARCFSSSFVSMNTTAAKSTVDHRVMSWNEFLKYRTYRRRMQVVSMGVFGTVAFLAGWEYVSSMPIAQPIFGLDPLVVTAGALIAFSGFCSLLGPILGNFIFNFVVLRGKRIPFRNKEDLFLNHIKKNRPDPSYTTFANPVPDYYGEKITSLRSYRKWLRDCSAYRKKREIDFKAKSE